eukprot:s1761_g11.t1
MSGVKPDFTMANLSWPAPLRPSGTSSTASPSDTAFPSSVDHSGSYGTPTMSTPAPFVSENIDMPSVMGQDHRAGPEFIRLMKHQVTYGDELDLQVQEINMVRGSTRDSRVEYFFHRLVGDWKEAQRLGNYWREHYNVPIWRETSHPPPDPSATPSASLGPSVNSLADISALDPATVSVAQLLTTLRALPHPTTPQESQDQLTTSLQGTQLPHLFTASDLSLLGDQLHQLAALVSSQPAETGHAGMELTPAEERLL